MKLGQLVTLFFIFNFIISCSSTEKVIVNKKITDPEGESMLIGRITQQALTEPEFNDWFENAYNSYNPDQKILKKIKTRIKLYSIEIFLGTWCSDSQEQVPKFLKILNTIHYPEKKLELYAVNKKKESFYGEQNQKGIQRVPTFIIYKGDKKSKRGASEFGRIVETPNGSFELELYRIITGKKFNETSKKSKSNSRLKKIKKHTRKK